MFAAPPGRATARDELTLPLQNRVTPFGAIVAVHERGTLMGNRGILHTAEQRVVRDWQVRRWIACRLEFRGRHRRVMQPGTYTELFFLDEAAALADGHRPCAECRHADYVAFQTAWRTAFPHRGSSASEMDDVLHQERRIRPCTKKTALAESASLPDGAYIEFDGRAWLVRGEGIYAWSPGAYTERAARPSGAVTLLTPPSIIDVVRAGYRAGVHPTSGME